MSLPISALTSITALIFGLFILSIEAADSADYWNYYDLFADRYMVNIGSAQELIDFIWSSRAYYMIMGPAFDVSPLLPYYLGWILLWVGLTAYGFRGLHWLLFISFFPGPDLMLNVIRQETALGVVAFLLSVRMPLIAFSAFLLHLSAPLMVGFVYISGIFEKMFTGLTLRTVLPMIVIIAFGIWLLTSSFFIMALIKLDAKRGMSTFNALFIYFVYVQLAILTVFSLAIRPLPKRLFFFGAALLCLLLTVLEIYFYRFIYTIYPFIIYEIGEALRIRIRGRKSMISWLNLGGIFGVVAASGVLIMRSIL